MASKNDVSSIGTFLETRAKLGDPIFYNDLAKHFELPPVTAAWNMHPLCEIFDSLDYQDQAGGRPFRTALVISREKSIPGEGFFKTLSSLRGTPYPIRNAAQKFRLWKEEFDRLASYYR